MRKRIIQMMSLLLAAALMINSVNISILYAAAEDNPVAELISDDGEDAVDDALQDSADDDFEKGSNLSGEDLTEDAPIEENTLFSEDSSINAGEEESSGPDSETTDFIYTTADGTATITGYQGESMDVAIPAMLGSCTVTEIGDSAFKNKAITSISIPEV